MEPHRAGNVLRLCAFLVVATASRMVVAGSPWAIDPRHPDALDLQDLPSPSYSTGESALPDAADARPGTQPATQEPARDPEPTAEPALAAEPGALVEPVAVAAEPSPPREPRQRGRLAGQIRDYWRDPDTRTLFIGGNYSRALGEFQLPDGTPLRDRSGFDVAIGFLVHPRAYLQVMYHREVWEASPVAVWSSSRLEFMYGLDLLALPPRWRVRPALMALLGFGVGRINLLSGPVDPQDPSLQMPVADKRGLGIGGVFAGELAIHLRINEHFEIVPYGGVMIPAYIYNRGLLGGEHHIDGEHGFGRAWRWLVGIKLGGTGSTRRGSWLMGH